MFWKIFAIITLLGMIGSVFVRQSEPHTLLRELHIVMAIISCAIIYSYAFKYPMKARNVARAFAQLFSVYSIWSLALSLVSVQDAHMEGRTTFSATVLVMAFICVQSFLEWLAVWRYGQDPAFAGAKADGTPPGSPPPQRSTTF
ncbi:MAG: hypothetical protein K0M55_14420 [Rhizobium sp.]|nr:hypothetical protein [Rhizobium sp.]